jgi:replication factor A1
VKNDDRTFYLACPEDSCKKKVIEESVGWRCENCNKTYPHCNPTYMLRAKISDVSDAAYVDFYRNEGTALMGLPADKLKELKDQGDIQVINEAYADRLYRHFAFLLKVRTRPGFGDNAGQLQYSYSCIKIIPHQYKTENHMLLLRLNVYKEKMGHVDKDPYPSAKGFGLKKRTPS